MSLLDIGLSGINAFQQMMQTAGNNMTNVATEGYSRQRVELSSKQVSLFDNQQIGNGVNIDTIRRVNSKFLTLQVRDSISETEKLDILKSLSSQIDNYIADNQGSIAPAMQSFFNSVNEAASNPSSLPARQVMISEAENLINRFRFLNTQLDASNEDINARMRSMVNVINTLANNIAEVNNDIALSKVRIGKPANELLDQRDKLLDELAKYINIKTEEVDNGTINVFIGNGQGLVIGKKSHQLTTSANFNDSSQLDIGFNNGIGTIVITDSINGGQLGGLMDYRHNVLLPIKNELGRIALVFIDTFNAQHLKGIDYNGKLGTNFFLKPTPDIFRNPSNTGTATVTSTIIDVTAITTSDYELSFDGSNFTLTRLSDGNSVSGQGPLSMDGIDFDISAGASAGDSFIIKPTKHVAGKIDLLLSSTKQIALASPIITAINGSNTGNGSISPGEVIDFSNTNLLNTVEIRFNNPPTTFDIVDVTTSTNMATGVTYKSGENIDFNGNRVQIKETPNAGDIFTLSANINGINDNRNGILLADLQNQNFVEGISSYQETYAAMVGKVGNLTQQTEINLASQKSLLESAIKAKEGVSGVNLEEELVDIVRYQHAFNAAAQIISISTRLFDTLIEVTK